MSLPKLQKEDDDMANTMTTSQISEPQIGRALGIFSDQLRAHAAEFPSWAVQIVFGQEDFPDALLQVFRRRVREISELTVRRVKVDRTRDPLEVLDATGRRRVIDIEAAMSMSRGEGEEVDVCFFLSKGRDHFESELKHFGLEPPDPYSLAKVNEEDPAFADKDSNGMFWKDGQGDLKEIVFTKCEGKRVVVVDDYISAPKCVLSAGIRRVPSA